MTRTETRKNSDWKDGFLFVGNHPALDFLNTRPVQNGEPTELLPDFDALLRWFRAAELLSARSAAGLKRFQNSKAAHDTLQALREFRERLRKQIIDWESGGAIRRSTIAELNRYMALYPMRTRLRVDGGESSTELWFEPREPNDLFAPLAHMVAALFAEVDPIRVRMCGHCILHFHDTSKKGTRRWCSMQLCGNRLKVAAYAARKRERVV